MLVSILVSKNAHKYLVYTLVETKGFEEERDGLGPLLGGPEITYGETIR